MPYKVLSKDGTEYAPAAALAALEARVAELEATPAKPARKAAKAEAKPAELPQDQLLGIDPDEQD